MEKIIFYKFKKVDNNWFVIFQDERGNQKIIKNNRNMLIDYLDKNNECIFIGANNHKYDDIFITSIIKDNSLNAPIDDNDIVRYLPRTLDITQGIVRNNLVDFNSIVCSVWGDRALINFYALNNDEIEKELIYNVNIISSLYNVEERKKFINWKINLIKNYNLSKESYFSSFGRIMENILGLKIEDSENDGYNKKFVLDSKLDMELKNKNDTFINTLLITLKEYYEGNNDNFPTTLLGKCLVKFNNQGIHGSIDKDIYDTSGNNTYLYIDFNSFGPSILINNGWLKDSAVNSERYKEIRDLRIALKSKKQLEQLFYKYILNAGLDDLSKVYTKDGDNVGLSLTVSGIMTMMLLYRNLEKYNIDLIECNTDGLIVKCPKKDIENIRNEVKSLEEKLSLSCDVDVVNKIVHFDEKNYIMEFENGKTKHLGVFGLFQDNPLNDKGVFAIDEALRNYYFYDIPVSETIRKLRDNNNLKAFQLIKRKKSNEKNKYLFIDGKYEMDTCPVNRLFAVSKDKIKNQFYVKRKNGNFGEYRVKRGKSVKDGYFYFEVSDRALPDINDIDITYYINECYKVIEKHHKMANININLNRPTGFAFIDLDGTLIPDKTEELQNKIFMDAAEKLSVNPDNEYNLFCKKNGNYIVQFLSECKKHKGYGTIDNFAMFLKEKGLFVSGSLNEYKEFVEKYLKLDMQNSSEIGEYKDARLMLEKLKNEGYILYLYSNWFSKVQKAKLKVNNLDEYFNSLYTIDNFYAKSSVKGWEDVLKTSGVEKGDLTIMIGNGSSDLVPKRFEIPSLIINRKGSISKSVRNNGIILNSFGEIIDKNFTEEIRLVKSRINKK